MLPCRLLFAARPLPLRDVGENLGSTTSRPVGRHRVAIQASQRIANPRVPAPAPCTDPVPRGGRPALSLPMRTTPFRCRLSLFPASIPTAAFVCSRRRAPLDRRASPARPSRRSSPLAVWQLLGGIAGPRTGRKTASPTSPAGLRLSSPLVASCLPPVYRRPASAQASPYTDPRLAGLHPCTFSDADCAVLDVVPP